ncbi:hypothetical protein J3S90_15620 [Flavobacterium sp. P4023]|uniref:Uncharacterized protein n=1 Tax=Flavobacterium flabelliforme TaxID=2816119 RepID=A0ABS5CX71_9FLAO|nr:hypothetical protein [Flavobacterium flabelliforme]MBP4143229.1 hypothetical protein [Flavobacterium flabelliforme]
MKNKHLLIIFLLFISCKKEIKEIEITQEFNKIEEIEINIPKLEKWKECKDSSLVKNWIERTSLDSLTKHYAVYLSNKTDLKKFETDENILQDFAIVYIRKQEQKLKINQNDLDRIFNTHIRLTETKKAKIKDALENIYINENYLEPNKFLLLEDYKINNNCKTAVLLMKQYVNNPKYVTIIILNWLNIKNHLFYSSYYLELNGEKSIEIAKENNRKIVTELMNLNK